MLPIFYINVASSTDRRQQMEQQFAALGIAAERVDAITVSDIPPALAYKHCQLHFWSQRWVTPAEIACTLTHRKTWQIIVDRGLDAALVLEDDAILSPRLPQVLDTLDMSGLDLVHMQTKSLPVTVDPGAGLKRLYTYHTGAAAYVLSNAGARKLLASGIVDYPPDDILFDPRGPMFPRMAVRQMVPAPCMAETGQSIVGDRSHRFHDPRRFALHRGSYRLFLRLKVAIREKIARARGAIRTTIAYDG